MATEPDELVSAHPSPAGRPTSLGGPGVEGPVDSSVVGVSTLGYPSGQAGLSEIGARSDVQMSPYSLASGIAETHAQLELSSSALAAAPDRQQLASRQPPIAATLTAAAQGLTIFTAVTRNHGNGQKSRYT